MDNTDYSASGFDKFLSRGDGQSLQGPLDQETIQSKSLPFDRNQVSGAVGDTFRVGKIYLNGSTGTIIMNDGTNDVLLIGEE